MTRSGLGIASGLRRAKVKQRSLEKAPFTAEVANISARGFWLFLGDREHFVSFKEFPWFVDSSVSKILNVQRPQEDHSTGQTWMLISRLNPLRTRSAFHSCTASAPNRRLQRTRSRSAALSRRPLTKMESGEAGYRP